MPFVFDDEPKSTASGFVFDDEQAPTARVKKERTWGEVAADTGVQLAEGVNNILGAVPSLVAPNSDLSAFFKDGADNWRQKQSDELLARQAEANQKIEQAGKEGVWPQIKAAASEYASDPALAARLGVTNIPSLIPGLGLGKLAQVGGAAAGLGAAGQAALGTGVAGVTNAALNAGGARGEAYDDIKQTLIAKGVSPADAEEMALQGSVLPAAVGAATGYLGGKIGLEKALLGQVTAGSAAKKAAGAFGAEMAGEQLEEVLPKLTTNAAVQAVDPNRNLTQDVGRTMVETAVGAGPMAAGAGVATGVRAYEEDQPASPVPPAPSAEPIPSATAAPAPAPSAAPSTAAAEKALLTPVNLTSLDRVNEIDQQGRDLMERTDELNRPGSDYGPMFDQERAELATQQQELQAERQDLTKDWPKAQTGAPASFTTEAGARVEANYALVDAADLVTSHDEDLRKNPLYPPELQPRERDRAASEMQVSGIVQKLDPARLGLSADAANGAPIVGADGLVESGNARTIALKRVYQANGQKAEDYKQYLRDNAGQFGLTADAIDTMAKPVLVRVRSTPVNRAEFARQANASTVAMMSPSEQAKSDANRIDSMEGLVPDDAGDFSNTASRPFVRAFMARLPMTEQAGMVDANGDLSTTGYARVRNAVLAKAYGDSPVLARITESMDDNLRNVSKALVLAAPKVAQMRSAVKAGNRFDADITPDLMMAVEELSRLKTDGGSVRSALAQEDVMGDQRTPEARQMLQFLGDNMRRPRRMADFIGAYMDALDAAGDPKQGSLLGDVLAPGKQELLTAAEKALPHEIQNSRPEGQGVDAKNSGQTGRQPANAQGRGSSGQANGSGQRPQGAANDAGQPGQGWLAFPSSTGTLRIPRAEMPQVKADHRGALISFLSGHGIDHSTGEVDPADLKPTQAEFSPAKVEKFQQATTKKERSVLVSADNYVLDGHHQWLAHLADKAPVKVITFNANIRELMAKVFEFPSVGASEGSTTLSGRDQAAQDFKDALSDLAQIASKHTRVAMVPENTPELMPTLVKLMSAGIKEVGYELRDLVKYVKDALKADPRLKTFWNKISADTYKKAALQAMEAGQAQPDDLFAQLTSPNQGGLFDGLKNEAPKVAMINGQAYDMKRDNFTPPETDTFIPAETLAKARAQIARLLKEAAPIEVSEADRARAETLLKPLLAQANAVKVEYDQKIIDIVKRTGAIGQMLAPVKGMTRAIAKLATDPDVNFDTGKMYDLLRSTIVVSSYKDAQSVVDAIRAEFEVLPGRIKDQSDAGIVAPETHKKAGFLPSGYGQVLINVRTSNGVTAEIQVNVPEMLAVKNAEGHKLYEIERAEPEGSQTQADAIAAQREIYPLAWAAAKKSASDILDQRSGHHSVGDMPSKGDFSSTKNRDPSGNSTYDLSTPSPSAKSMPNRQPGGNLSGTLIDLPPANNVAQKTEKGYSQSTLFGERNGNDTDGAPGTQGQSTAVAPATGGPGKAKSVRGGRGGTDRNGVGRPDAGPAAETEVGSTGPGSVRSQNEDGTRTEPGDSDGRPAGVPAGRDIPPKSGQNYEFGPDDLTYTGSWQKRAGDNLAAVELVKALEAEGRQATRDEQTVLAKFAGWGAGELANNLFGKKLDKVAQSLQAYQAAVDSMVALKRDYLQKGGQYRGQYADTGYYQATEVLRVAGKLNQYETPQRVTRAELDAVKPDAAAVRWLALRDRLKEVLSPQEWAEASRSTQYAHYTSKAVVQSMWKAMERMGFKGGSILEPGAGIGVFPGLMPSAMAANSSYTGIEFDGMTGAILKQLFPDERILTESFVDSKLPKNFYDVAAGNPPFSGTKILGDPEYAKLSLSLHDYFFAKSLDRVKPGGLVMFVTSRYTMDKLSDKARSFMAERADLVGAIRLPQTAFKQNAGTDVVTDVIFLRKKVKGETFASGQDWLKTATVSTPEGPALVNEYYAAHPEMVLGSHSMTGKMQNTAEPQYTVLPMAGDIEAHFAKAVENLPENIYQAERGSSGEAAQVREIDFNPKAKKEGNYYVTDAGVLMVRESGVGIRADKVAIKDRAMLADFVPLRDALKQAHYDQLNDGDWEPSLAQLQTAYASFVKKHGHINQFTSKTVNVKAVDEETGEAYTDEETRRTYTLLKKIEDDPDWTLVAALENVNDDTGEITQGKFLTERVLGKPAQASINTPSDALLSVLNDIGHVDIPTIAHRLSLSQDDTIEALGSTIYKDPEGAWVTADEYLSGNVKKKLELAQEAAKADTRMERNVRALEAVQPEAKTPSQINASMGMNWIPGAVYEQFLADTAGVKARIEWNARTKQWIVQEASGGNSLKATADWGTDRRNITKLMEHGLTGSKIRIETTTGSGADKVTAFDPAATEAATTKLVALQNEFQAWLWRDAKRSDLLVREFNDKFNTTVARSFDGRHLQLPGSSTTYNIFDHVKRGAWRIIQSGNTYLAHAVGSGKTFQMVISAMEQKRLGLIKKPMMVVPNHMLQQFAREWQDLYPAARLMVADENNFHTDNRRRFVSRVALSDLDGVIITQSAFKILDLDPKFKQKMIQEQLDYMRAALEEAGGDPDALYLEQDGTKKNGEAKYKLKGGGKSMDPRIKQIEKQIENMEQKLMAATSGVGKDQNARFDELGVDFLYVDEAHNYRKLDFTTNRQVKGVTPAGSGQAFDLYMKSSYLEEKTPGRSLVMASGTPVTNTIAELYTVQKFMGRQAMVDRGIEDFDSWAAMFGREKTELEPNAAGTYEPVTRFTKFVNVPELTQMFREYADVLNSDHLAALLGDKRPKVEGGSRNIVITPKTEEYAQFQDELVRRVEASRKWKPSKEEPNNPDPIIKIIGDGRLAAIDMRFMDPSLPNNPDSKLNRLSDDVIRTYAESADMAYNSKSGEPEPNKGASMMVFSDLGFGAGVAVNRGFNARGWFEKRLRDGGVNMSQVAFMSDYKKSSDKLKLFKDVNAGRVRILVGSSKNMGTGVNAQQRLKALFHLDSPWYPADLEQREGRAVRQGNKNPLVQLFAYAAKGTYDENMWKMLASKQYFIDQALSGDPNLREIEDLDSQSQYDLVAAMVADDPRVLQLAGAKADIEKMQRLYQAHEQQRYEFGQRYRSALATVEWAQSRMTAALHFADKVINLAGDKFTAKAGKTDYTVRIDWAKALLARYKELIATASTQTQTVGEISGFKVAFQGQLVANNYITELVLELPDPVALATDPGTNEVGMTMRATNALAGVATYPAKLRERISEAKGQMDALQGRLETPFPMAEMLANKIQEAQAIEFDIMRGQPGGPEVTETLWGDMPVDAGAGNDADVVLSRGAGGGMDLGVLQKLAAKIQKRMPNMPAVHVLASPALAPKALRDYIEKQGAMNDVDGALHNGELYLFASGLTDELRAEHVLAEHEAAHFGLRAILGEALPGVMRAIFNNNASVRLAAKELQKRGKLSDTDATEEVIVDIPTNKLIKLKGWRKVVQQVRTWLSGHGFDKMAAKISAWLDGSLSDQQRADVFVANLVNAARVYMTGKRGKRGKVRADTMLSGTLAEDWAKQEKWLASEAKSRGYTDIDQLAEQNYPLFEKLAALWREKNPADEGVLLSRAPLQGTAAERADKIIQTNAATAKPIDAMARALTKITGVERFTTAIYKRAGYLLDRYTPETIKAGMVSDYGVPDAVIDQRAMMQGRQRVQLRQTGSLIEKLATLTRAESRIAYEWLNETDPHAIYTMMQNLPEESVKVLMEVQAMVDKLSREAVRMGQLSPDAYERNKFAYLRRSYVKHTLSQTAGEKKSRARAISILGDQYKGRGLTESATMAQIQNSAPDWWARKLAKGKADTSLKGEKFLRLERHAPSGQGTAPLPGMTGKQAGKLKEVHYFPAGERLPAKYADWTAAGTFEVRDTKGANVILWRDFTKDERENMGEIDEARFAIAKTLHAMIHDVEVGRYLEWLAHNYAKKEGETIPGVVVDASERYADTFKPGEWVKVPDSKIQGTAVVKYGTLAGRYLPGPVWNDLRQTVNGQFRPFGDTYAKILSFWKTSKTALSPGVHMNNIMSNMVMADWHDVTAGHTAKALRIILGAHKQDGKGVLGTTGNKLAGLVGHGDREAARAIMDRYLDSGGNIGSWATNEIGQSQVEPLLAAMEAELAATSGQSQQAQVGVMSALQHTLMLRFPSAFEAAKGSIPGKLVGNEAGTLIDMYQSEDEVFRLASWLKSKEEGKTDMEAGKISRVSFMDYNINAPWVQAMRNSALPFISYTYRAVPMMLETMAKKPHKLMKLMLMAGALNALGVMLAGGDDDEERKLLPEEKAGRIWGMVPKLIRMPWNDANSSPVYLDIRRFIPVGDVLDVGANHAAVPMLPMMTPGGPLVILGEIVLNKTGFTGKPITLETDTPAQQTTKVMDYLFKAFAPNVLGLPGTYATTGVLNAAKGKTDAFGREQSVAQAVASSFGVKLGSYPADVMRKNEVGKAQAMMMEIDKNISQLKRQRQTNSINDAEFQSQVQVEQDKKRKVQEDLAKKLGH